MNTNPRVIQCGVPQNLFWALLFLIFINDITICSINLNTFTRMIAHSQLVYHVTMLWTLLAELINNGLKCLYRWLKSNQIIIYADRVQLFSYNKNANFPIIRIDNNKINEISVTKFLVIYLDKKLNFINHLTEMSMKVAKSIGF